MTDAVRTTAAPAERGTALRYAADCALIVAGLMVPIAIVVAFFQPSWSRTTVWLPMLFVLGAAGPFVLVARGLQRERAVWAMGAATGLAWMAMLLIIDVALFGDNLRTIWARGGGLFWLLMGYLLAARESVSNLMPTSGYVLFVPLFIASAYLAKHAHRARAGIDLLTNHEWFRGWAFSLGYVLVGLPVFLKIAGSVETRELAKRDERSTHYAQATVDVRKLLCRVQNCLYWYESEPPNEGVPRGLDALGPVGIGCFDTTAMTGTLAHSRIRYAATAQFGVDGVRSYWTDKLGRIHWTRQNRAATADDPVVEECDLGRPCEG